MTHLTFRRADWRDVDTLTYLDEICFSVPWSRDAFEQELTKNHLAFYIVAEAHGAVVGYAGLWAVVGEGHITNVAVHPDYHKRGVGERLLHTLMRSVAKNGVDRFTLEVRKSNEAAIRLYEKFGFRTEGIRKEYYEDTKEDALIMWADFTTKK